MLQQVACGDRHTVALSEVGELWVWGTGLPRLIYIYLKFLLQQIACGDRHTVALSDVGELWVWGTGLPLGLNQAEQVLCPKKIEYLEGKSYNYVL